MEQNIESFSSFETALERRKLRKCLPIYDKTSDSTTVKSIERQYTSKDVLLNIAKQLDHLKAADDFKKDLNKLNKFKSYEKSKLVPVNLMSVGTNLSKLNSNITQFGTQCVSDTQLISIVENVEKIVPPKDMSQEFENSFCERHIGLEKDGYTKTDNMRNSFNNENVASDPDFQIKNNHKMCTKSDINKNGFDEDIMHNLKKELNCNEHEKIKECDGVEIKENFIVSPIINYIKPLSLTNSQSPLVYKLDAFENFEMLAFPIVEKNVDLEAAKQLINSQILDKELYLAECTTSIHNRIDRPPSPVLPIGRKTNSSSCPVVDKIKNVSLKVPDKNIDKKVSQQTNIDVNKYFEDEILFSSDEEDRNEVNSQDLPLTCALETSFYNQCGILDKTMYVGFQTASNKSIKISTESFSKAQSVLEDIDSFKPTLTELVAKCEGKLNEQYSDLSKTDDQIGLSKSNEISKEESCCKSPAIIKCLKSLTETQSIMEEINRSKKSNEDSNANNRNLEGVTNLNEDGVCKFPKSSRILGKKQYAEFHTASNKRIKLSETSLAKCQKIFNNIDLNEKYNETITEDINIGSFSIRQVQDDSERHSTGDNPSIAASKQCNTLNKSNKKEISDQIKLEDQNIIKEFENDLLDFDIFRIDDAINCKSNENKRQSKYDANPVDEKFFPNQHLDKYVKKTFTGFNTASNKQIAISENALRKSKFILNDFNFSDCVEGEEDLGNSFKHGIDKNSDQNVSELKVSCNHKDEISAQNELCSCDALHINDKIEKTETLALFKTASEKPVTISSEALVKSRKLLKEMESFVLDEAKDLSDHAVKKFQGLKTTCNKIVPAPDSALGNTKNFVEDIHSHNDKSNENKTLHSVYEKLPLSSENVVNISEKSTYLPKFEGFRTASNKKVNISDQAMAKSKIMFQDLELHNNEQSQFQHFPVNEFKGFETASNKQIKVSNESLAKSKSLFQDFDLDGKHEEKSINNQETDSSTTTFINEGNLCSKLESPQNHSFIGFQTANNKKVKVSDQALALSKKLLQDLELDETMKRSNIVKCMTNTEAYKRGHECQSVKNQTHNVLFKTANNKDVKITQEALSNAKQILELSENVEVIKAPHTVSGNRGIDGNQKNITESVLDSEIINNFEMTMCTEDFCNDIKPAKSKRSGSPILLCTRAKKRKRFEAPRKNLTISEDREITKITHEQNITVESFIYDENYKKTKNYTLKDLKNMEKLNQGRNEVDPYIANFNYETLLYFEFSKDRNEFSDVTWTTEDLKKYFLSSINKKLIPDGWLDNHLKLIILKLITYEKEFENIMPGVCSAKNVLKQLKYRYDRELHNVERPALRKLLEHDDVSTKTMILRVIQIYTDAVPMTSVTETSDVELLLTDGWYCVKACLDQMLVKLVRNQKITVGTKLAIHGAKLLNCDQGLAPWEDTSRVRLKIFGNSTRRARWDVRLGWHGAGAILTRLSNVQLNGGKVSKLRAIVTRVYPTLYVEKFEDGSTVTRSERLEHLYQMKYESERHALLEKMYEEVEKEFTNQESQDSECDSELMRSIDNGSQIYKMMRQSRDPGEYRANLTKSQCVMLQDYSSRRREKLLQTVQSRVEERLKTTGLYTCRNVVPVMKIRLADISDSGEISKAMMSVWRPSDAVQDIIKEGVWIDMFNIIPTALRFSELQFSAGRQTIFSRSNYKESSKTEHITSQLKRFCCSIKDLVKNPVMSTYCNEVDLVGLVFLVDPSMADFETIKGQLFQNVYLTDAEKNIVCVNFWGGLKKFGYENIIDMGQVLACMNLQKRAGNSRKSIPQFRATEFSHFTKTPKLLNLRQVVEDLNRTLSSINIKKLTEECVSKKNHYSILKYSDGENISPYRINYSDYSVSRHKAFIDSPLTRKRNYMDDVLNLSGLDFESTFKQTDTQDMAPSTLLRKKKVNEKIAKLKMYGEPPPITPIHTINQCNNAARAFKNPLSSKNSVSTNVYSETFKEQATCSIPHDNSSPKLCFKNSIKRNSGNPVKLNFSNALSTDDVKESKVGDPFAEEFDVSPPLSLD